MSIDEAAAVKAVQDGLDGRNVPIVHEEIRVVLAMALERDALRARIAELERERDMALAERNERQKALEVTLEERTSALAERNWANERHDEARAEAARLRAMLDASGGAFIREFDLKRQRATVVEADAHRARAAEAERERDEARKDLSGKCLDLAMETVAHAKTKLALEEAQRAVGDVFENLDLNSLNHSLDEARADAARLREALTQVRDAMLATGQEPDGDDDPRRPVATAVWRALASAPSAETWRQVGQHAAHPELDAHSTSEPTSRDTLNTPQPAPVTNDAGPEVWPALLDEVALSPELRALCEERDKMGRAKYGTALRVHNGREPLVDALQEALDLAVYLHQAWMRSRDAYLWWARNSALELAQEILDEVPHD